MPHLYPFLSSKRPYLQLFQQLQTLLHDKKKVIYLFGTDIHIYTGKAGVGKSPNQSFLFI